MNAFRNKKVLVTGANGFIGQHIIAALASQKAKVTCVTLHGPNPFLKQILKQSNVTFKKMDLAKPFSIPGKFDYIFHAAGYGQPSKFLQDPEGTIAINVDATKRLLEIAARSHGTFVFFSSAEVYGEMPRGMKAFKESYVGATPTDSPRAVYAAAKRVGETLTMEFTESGGVRGKIVRISHVYGPGAPAGDRRVMSDLIRKALHGGVIRLLDAGKSVKTYGDIHDVVSMILFAAARGKDVVYNVGGRDTMSIRKLAEKIGKECGVKVIVPKKAARARFVGRDPSFVKLDLGKIKREMKGFSFTPFSRGLRETIAWSRKIERKA